ncbi:MAG TPA: hypothetical protein VFG99_08605, partial [Chloroflexia bacterium]|nr:hypothetical protein [Chloroflexia bacterium]
EARTGHNIPSVFWDFLNSSGEVYEIVFNGDRLVNDEQLTSGRLSSPWYYAAGMPISEAYWAKASIRGETTDVLVQAYERRVLTYVPTNDPGFQVEMGNIGQHYFDWRYRNAGLCPGGTPGTPTPPRPAPTGTIPATTPTIFSTPPPLPTGSVTPAGTGTPPLPPTLAVPTGTITPLPLSTDTPAGTAPAGATGTPTPATVP